MLVAGIDVGARNISTVVLWDSDILSHYILTTGAAGATASRTAIEEALRQAGLDFADLQCTVATGCGGNSVPFADFQSTEVVCQARGVFYLSPSVRTVVNLGAESSRAIKVGETGRVEAFSTNNKCAAGSGVFLETMSTVLEIPIESMGELSLKADSYEEVSSICAVFAESEVISHIHRGVPKDRILAGVHRSVTDRILETLGTVGIKSDVMATGGVAKNLAIIKELENKIGLGIIVITEPQVVGALGAALSARDRATKS